MNGRNGSHEENGRESIDAAQSEPRDSAAGREVVFVEVRRTEPLGSYGPLCLMAALLVGITLGRIVESLDD